MQACVAVAAVINAGVVVSLWPVNVPLDQPSFIDERVKTTINVVTK